MAHAAAHESEKPAHEADVHAHPVHAPGDDLPHHGLRQEEPKSPAWLPILGVVLLATAIVWWLSTPSDADEAAAAAAASASASAAASAPSAMVSAGPAPEAAPRPALTANNAPPRPEGMPALPPGMQYAPGAAINPKFKKP